MKPLVLLQSKIFYFFLQKGTTCRNLNNARFENSSDQLIRHKVFISCVGHLVPRTSVCQEWGQTVVQHSTAVIYVAIFSAQNTDTIFYYLLENPILQDYKWFKWGTICRCKNNVYNHDNIVVRHKYYDNIIVLNDSCVLMKPFDFSF